MSNLSLNQLKKENEIEDNIIKDIRKFFKSKGKVNAIKDNVLRDIRTLFESDEDHYYKPIRTNNAFSNNYIEYESSNDKNKSFSVKEYLNMIRPYLSHVINGLKAQGEWKIELTMEINFMSSEDSKDSKDSKDYNETRTVHRKSNNLK